MTKEMTPLRCQSCGDQVGLTSGDFQPDPDRVTVRCYACAAGSGIDRQISPAGRREGSDGRRGCTAYSQQSQLAAVEGHGRGSRAKWAAAGLGRALQGAIGDRRSARVGIGIGKRSDSVAWVKSRTGKWTSV